MNAKRTVASKMIMCGVGLTTLMAFGSSPLLHIVHAQQAATAQPMPPTPIVPLTFVVRDDGHLYMLIHAEGGQDAATQTLHQVTIVAYNDKQQAEDVYQSDAVQMKVAAEPGKKGEQRTTLTLHGAQDINLLGEKRPVLDAKNGEVALVISFLSPYDTLQQFTEVPPVSH